MRDSSSGFVGEGVPVLQIPVNITYSYCNANLKDHTGDFTRFVLFTTNHILYITANNISYLQYNL